jgi:hypothetical protein
MKIPTLQEVEAYCREKDLHVNPKTFIDHYEAAEPPWTYYDRKGKQKPVRNWKQKILNVWEDIALSNDKAYPCSHGSWGSCKKPGVYPAGKDRDGHQLWRCIDHKPKPKPLPAEHPANTIKLKKLSSPEVNVNNRRNEEMDKLAK